MTTLPSFDQLVSTLGVDTTSRPRSSSSASAQHNLPPARSFTRSRSNSSLKMSRYAPYSPTSNLHVARRSSISSSCSSALSSPDLPESRLSPLPRRRKQNPLTINVYGDSPTERRDAPISAYVRRKTPGASPVSATFDSSRESSPSISPMPFLLPMLPTVLPPMNTDNGPSQRTRDYLRPAPAHLLYKTKSLTEMFKGVSLSGQSGGLSRARRHTQTGVRISSPAARAPAKDANTHRRHGSSHIG